MKISKKRLREIIREELQKEEDGSYTFSPTLPADQGEEPSNVDISKSISNLENARIIVALAIPECLEQLDYVITKMKSLGSFPSDTISPYTLYEESDDEE